MKSVNKIIEVEFCEDCPLYGECDAWQKLNGQQIAKLTISVGIKPFILKNCHLTDGPDLYKLGNKDGIN